MITTSLVSRPRFTKAAAVEHQESSPAPSTNAARVVFPDVSPPSGIVGAERKVLGLSAEVSIKLVTSPVVKHATAAEAFAAAHRQTRGASAAVVVLAMRGGGYACYPLEQMKYGTRSDYALEGRSAAGFRFEAVGNRVRGGEILGIVHGETEILPTSKHTSVFTLLVNASTRFDTAFDAAAARHPKTFAALDATLGVLGEVALDAGTVVAERFTTDRPGALAVALAGRHSDI